jgi:tetratricopeptide (TPR) repeat protein
MKKTCMIIGLILFFSTGLFASYKEALKLFEQNDYKGSLKMIANELETSDDMKPDSPNYNLRFLAAHNHWKLGNTKSAIDHFSRCIAIKKNAVETYVDLSLLQIELKKYGDAETTARRGLEAGKSSMLYYIMGIVSMKKENYWKSKEMFEKANSIDPELYYSYNALGITLMKLKKYGEANTAFSAAHAVKPRSVEIINNLGMSYEKLGKNKDAYEYYQKAVALDDKNKIIAGNLERIKGKLKN